MALAKDVVQFTDAASRVAPYLARGEGNHPDATSGEKASFHRIPAALLLRLVPVVPVDLDGDDLAVVVDEEVRAERGRTYRVQG